jgi:hypothetical protein
MIYAAAALFAALAILAFFRLLTVISRRRNRPTAAEVADKIERHIDGTEGPFDWDAFTSSPIWDDRLDEIRRLCSDTNVTELRKIVEDLRKKFPQ